MVMELVAILPVYQVDLAVLEADEVQEAPEVVDLVDHRELQDHPDACWRRIIGIISSFVLKCNQLELTSQILSRTLQMFHARGSYALLKKLNLDTGQTLTPFGLERGFLTQVLEKKRCLPPRI